LAVLNLSQAGTITLSHNDTIDPIWRAIAGHPVDPGDLSPEKLHALADLISAAGVAAVVPGSEVVLGDGMVRQARLLNRFRRLQGEKWATLLNRNGIRAVAMKGLSTAHSVWPDADARAVSDADLLVSQTDLPAALSVLKDEGFAFADVPTRSLWGFVGDASFQPLIGPGDSSNVDLHVHGDTWPFSQALGTSELIDNATESATGGIWLPTPTHRFLIAASHAAGDLYTSDAIKSVVDGMLMLRTSDAIDFTELLARASRGNLLKPVTLMLSLLQRLGGNAGPALEAGFRLESLGGWEFERVVSSHETFFMADQPLGTLNRLRREILLCAEPRVALWRNGRRLTGLIRPRTGLPAGNEP
jgi:hypothetical protein